MKAKAFLFVWFITGTVFGRVVLLTTDNPTGKKTSVPAAGIVRALDEATDLALFERPDPDPCHPLKKTETKLLARASSETPRDVAAAADLPGLLRRAREGEDVTIYAVSWDRRLELRGLDATPVPTQATLPRWVEKDFSKAAAAVLSRTEGTGAAVLYADLAPGGLDRSRWEALGVWFPKEAPRSAVPFLTRVDFRRPKRVDTIGFASKNISPRVRPELSIREPFTGRVACLEAAAWIRGEPERVRAESMVLHELTGWPLLYVLSRVGIHPSKADIETVQP